MTSPSLDFGFLTDDVFFLEKNFENLTSQKKFSPAPAGQKNKSILLTLYYYLYLYAANIFHGLEGKVCATINGIKMRTFIITQVIVDYFSSFKIKAPFFAKTCPFHYNKVQSLITLLLVVYGIFKVS